MLKIRPRKADIKAVAAMFEGEYDSPEALASAVLEKAWELLQERGKYTVVGQLRYSRFAGGYVDADDARASKVCLGLFATEGEARAAAESLAFSAHTGEEFRTWVLPVEHKTAAEVYAARKEAHRERSAWEQGADERHWLRVDDEEDVA